MNIISEYAFATEALMSEIMIVSAEVTRLREIAAATGPRPTDGVNVQSGGGSDRTGGSAIKIVDMERQLVRTGAELSEVIQLMQEAIRTLPSPKERTVLSLKYISRLTHEDIAGLIGKSERQEYRIHQAAVSHLNQRSGEPRVRALRKKCQNVMECHCMADRPAVL